MDGIYYLRNSENKLKTVGGSDNPEEVQEKAISFIKEQLKQYVKSDNLCFLIGSGCSVGAIPLMSSTFEEIKKNIEKKEFLGEFIDSSDIEGYLNWVNKAIEFSSDKKGYEEAKTITKKSLLKTINIEYSEPEIESILENYKQFYKKIFENRKKNDAPVNIFTTNYDLFNEKSLESNNILYTNGFKGIIDREFDIYTFNYRIVDEEFRYKDKWSPIKNYVKLYKLHGSIDWKYNEVNKKIIQSPYVDEGLDESVVVYPSILKHFETQQTPYSELFRELSIKLQERNTTLIIIGYGFPDVHINSLITQALNNDDFNLIVISDIKEKNIKNFYDINKNRNNFTIIGGELLDKSKLHYFSNVIKFL